MEVSLLSKKHFADFFRLAKTQEKMKDSLTGFLELFGELGKKYNDEPAQSLFISSCIVNLLKSCNAKKSEVKPMLETLIEATLKD